VPIFSGVVSHGCGRGFIRYQHFREGAYEENEQEIQELLAEKDQIQS
jgi:hypothetical protein